MSRNRNHSFPSAITFLSTAMVLAILQVAALPCYAEKQARRGLVAKKPAKGRFVKTDRGYMIPYTMKMPGGEGVVEMVPIPAGSVLMGSPATEDGRRTDEGPQVKIAVEPFWMAKYEITWAEYKQFMSLYDHFKTFETQRIRPVTKTNRIDAITAPTELYDSSYTFDKGEDPRLPAVTMTQYAAKQYTKWLSLISGDQFRLPTESEWEYACRAGTDSPYHFGHDASQLGDYAWFKGNSDETPHFIGLKKPNPWGLHDMHGNVAEWVLDEYSEKGYQWLEGKQGLTAVAAINWPTKPYPRVVRGGSWSDPAELCRSAVRLGSQDEDWKDEDPNIPLSPWWFTSDPSRGVGFRLVRPLKELPKSEMKRYWEIDSQLIRDDVEARLEEGRGVLGVVDPSLIEAIKKLEQ